MIKLRTHGSSRTNFSFADREGKRGLIVLKRGEVLSQRTSSAPVSRRALQLRERIICKSSDEGDVSFASPEAAFEDVLFEVHQRCSFEFSLRFFILLFSET